jgi:3-methyladenine DNA glycosylase/8-oxoguanine DNA glycosylase
VVGQQLSVSATRTIVSRLRERFGGRMPSLQELLAARLVQLSHATKVIVMLGDQPLVTPGRRVT